MFAPDSGRSKLRTQIPSVSHFALDHRVRLTRCHRAHIGAIREDSKQRRMSSGALRFTGAGDRTPVPLLERRSRARSHGRQDSTTGNQKPDRLAQLQRVARGVFGLAPGGCRGGDPRHAGERAGHHFPRPAARSGGRCFRVSRRGGAATTPPRDGARTGRRHSERDVAGRSHGAPGRAAQRGRAAVDPPAHPGGKANRASPARLSGGTAWAD